MNYAQIGRLPHENTPTHLKAETPAEGETLQRLRGRRRRKIKTALINAF